MGDLKGEDGSSLPFMVLFAMHLASRLIGEKILIEQLQRGDDSIHHYWRTNLFENNSSLVPTQRSEMMVGTTDKRQEWSAAFLDVSFEWCKSSSSTVPSVSLALGALVMKTADSSQVYYIKASPLSYSTLEQHAEQIGIDLESTAPHAMAHSFHALLRGAGLTAPPPVLHPHHHLINTTNPIDVDMHVCYPDLQETAPLILKACQVCKLDGNTHSMVVSNLSQHDKCMLSANANSLEEKNGETKEQATVQLEDALRTWWSRSKQMARSVEARTKATASPVNQPVSENGARIAQATNQDTTVSSVVGKDISSTAAEANPLHNKSTMPIPPSTTHSRKADYTKIVAPHPKRKKKGKITYI